MFLALRCWACEGVSSQACARYGFVQQCKFNEVRLMLLKINAHLKSFLITLKPQRFSNWSNGNASGQLVEL